MVSQYTQQQLEQLIAEHESLRKQLAEKEGVVSKLEESVASLQTELAWLRKKVFGKMSERFITADPDARQLDIFGEQLSQAEREELEKAAQQDKVS